METKAGARYSFITDRIIVLMAYLTALLGAWGSISFIHDADLWMKIAFADFIGTIIIFSYSYLLKNSSLYDPYWSVAPIIIWLSILIAADMPLDKPRIILTTLAVIYWGVRLTMNWLKTWPGLMHEDWRYHQLAADTGKGYWFVSFLGIHLLPTIIVFLGCLPMLPVAFSDKPLLWTDIVGFLIAFAAVEIERRADNQLRKFKNATSSLTEEVCERGLWKYSRHPNYFGEIMFWAGLFVISWGLDPSFNIKYGLGLIAMIILFVFISIPMMEKRQLSKTGYEEYRRRVSALVPWFNKN